MTTTAQQALATHYRSLERGWKIQDRSMDYARLVVPGGNMDEPLHRWFRFKEAFSSQLFPRLLKDAGWEPVEELSLYDPFAGSGTTLVSALASSVQFKVRARLLGVERNPVMRVIAAAKVAAAVHGPALAGTVGDELPCLLQRYEKFLKSAELPDTPSVTLNNEKYFPKVHVRALTALRLAIDGKDDVNARLIYQTCLAASVEPAGRLRRDGRALRHAPERTPNHPRPVFEQLVNGCIRDLQDCEDLEPGSQAMVDLGDGRIPPAGQGDAKFDWIVFSPPYPNNIDYTEVYKTEAWAMGSYEGVEDMRQQRLSTVRSHPSILFPEEYSYHDEAERERFDKLLNPLLSVIPRDRYTTGRRQIVKGYADDMFQVLKSCRKMIADEGRLVFVVGNSVHGVADAQFVIAADLIMAALAEFAGWTVDEIRVARWTTRRGSQDPFLRESVVCLTPSR